MTNLFNRFGEDESGQGITEYGAVLAFVAVLILVVATWGYTQLEQAILNTSYYLYMALYQLFTALAS